MTVKPILFNTEMVRAILDEQKTVTRRIIKPQPKMILSYISGGCGYGKWTYPESTAYRYLGEEYRQINGLTDKDRDMLWTPPCNADDILYVGETWMNPCNDLCYAPEQCDGCIYGKGYRYKADYRINADIERWHPSIHMPKEAARIWLKVTEVRVERIQDITREQAVKEGTSPEEVVPDVPQLPHNPYFDMDEVVGDIQKLEASHLLAETFGELWDSTVKESELDKYGWEANPWVWVIEFERCDKPEEMD